jgi:hypothetical protein
MDQQNAFAFGIQNGGIHPGFLRGEVFAKAHVDDTGAIVDGITDGECNVLVVFVAVGYGADHHDPDIVIDAVDAFAVIPFGSDDAGDVGAVQRLSGHDIAVAVITVIEIFFIVADDFMAIIFGRIFFAGLLLIFLFHLFVKVGQEGFVGHVHDLVGLEEVQEKGFGIPGIRRSGLERYRGHCRYIQIFLCLLKNTVALDAGFRARCSMRGLRRCPTRRP